MVRPRDLAEAVRLTTEGGQPLAGGTDLFVRLQKGVARPGFLVYVGELPELRLVRGTEEEVEIGAAVTHAAILAHPATARVPVLRLALQTIGSPALRHMGTLGGNLANASPAGDGLVPLYLLDARVNLAGPGGERSLPVAEFVRGPGKTALRPGELIRSITVPLPKDGAQAYFRKVGRRRALLIAVASLGALVWLEEGVIAEARLALGSVAPTVIRPREVERALVGRPLTVEALAELRDALSSAVQPISDLRASADYRRRVAGNLLLDLASQLAHFPSCGQGG
ncbi:xanthine dehydrogenase family protein subunit M [Candidatus Bipolaricaulota bacterium]|nr:xanthine dehydrogenase family protein subunit M [Candidatus Bipolaricaulota bacterium]